ncbi:hypothetical protein Tco_1030392 [Tanacetum coccineum]|uniref:Reverse transcriptase domain-containing protein n=1 Tax=Tanacetum coccineum TaxID=301880 RepID=A0ABQ5G6E1_9ASTR
MTTPVEKRNASKFCEFHREVGHTTDECMHLKRQIEEMLKAGKLSHLIKELKQSNGKDQRTTFSRRSASNIRSKFTTSGKEMGNPQKSLCGGSWTKAKLQERRLPEPTEVGEKAGQFHEEVGHTTDECMHLKRQIEELLKAGKLSHLIKELKQSNGKDQAKAAKKGETSGKD